MNRRSFVHSATLLGMASSGFSRAAENTSLPMLEARPLENWKPGMLDIHQLAYGRGNSAFILCPDGTTMLLDAGVTDDSSDVSSAQMPNSNVRPGEWIARYVLRQMKAAARQDLDYFLLTHIHPDHVGDVAANSPVSTKGSYRLTGLMDVDALVPIRKLIDRGFPDYEYPVASQAPFALNYRAYVKSRQQRGEACERIEVGRSDQIRLLRDPDQYAAFSIRNLAANGEVWTGVGDNKRTTFPALEGLSKDRYPTENMCSAAIRISYGQFDFYTGGDLTGLAEPDDEPWRDIESEVARAAGPVDVAVANHHAYFDAVSANFVRALQPGVFVIPTWYVAHPCIQQLSRMLSQQIYPAARDVFATNVMAVNRVFNTQFMGKLKSQQGHVVIRVAPGGAEFQVIILDNSIDTDRVKASFGPYACK